MEKCVLNGDAVNGSTQSRLLVARNKTRQRWQPAMRLSDVLLGYLWDAADDPSPIKLIEAGGKLKSAGSSFGFRESRNPRTLSVLSYSQSVPRTLQLGRHDR